MIRRPSGRLRRDPVKSQRRQITHEVNNVGNDRAQLADMAKRAKATLESESLDVVADRGYYSSEEILACENEGVTVTQPKPMTSGARRFGKQDFRYVAEQDVYICPAGQRLAYSFTTQEHGLVLHRYLTNVCQRCAIKHRCTTGKERRITRYNAGSTSIRRRCASGGRRSSIRSAPSKPAWVPRTF